MIIEASFRKADPAVYLNAANYENFAVVAAKTFEPTFEADFEKLISACREVSSCGLLHLRCSKIMPMRLRLTDLATRPLESFDSPQTQPTTLDNLLDMPSEALCLPHDASI